jgi:hypothetical protein
MSDLSRSVPPPSGAPPTGAQPDAPEQPAATREALSFTIESGRRRSASGEDRLLLTAAGITIEHGRVLQAPLELPLGLVKVAGVDPGPAKASGQTGRFPILRRVSATAVIPREEGIEGWLWTGTGGTALTNLGDDDEAPNVALVFTKPLDDERLRTAFDPEFVTALAARSPLGSPTVLGVLFRVADTLPAGQGFRRWGFQDVLTDREIPPVQRRHLPTDKSADPAVRGAGADAARARTSVAPPGFG